MTTFVLPEGLEATAPPPVRDGVRLLVARPAGIEHVRFTRLAEVLAPGDLVVVNTSGTLAAAVDGVRQDGRRVTVHLATELAGGEWVVELRPPDDRATGPLGDVEAGEPVALPGGVRLLLVVWRANR